jgi:DNA-binding Lrp family transcriptional regulator
LAQNGKSSLGTENNKDSNAGIDDLDIRIVNQLLVNPAASSTDLARKFRKPLSTVQRRRSRLERTILQREYKIISVNSHWRSGEFFATVAIGKTLSIAKEIYDKYCNLTLVTTTVNHIGNLMAHIYFKDSSEMFEILEDLKSMPDVTNVEYAEHVEKVGERKPLFLLEDLKGK